METAGGALAPVLFAAFSLPCALLLFTLGRAALHAAADALRGDRGGGGNGNGNAWRPTRSAFLGYRVARPGGGASGYPGSVFRDDDEPPLPRECCDRLPLAAYRQEQGRPDPECVFCLSAVVDGDEVRELRCRHVFHRGCLDAWLVRPRATCPLCRDRLLPADDPPRACAADDADGYGYGFGFGFEDDGAAHGDLSSTSPPPSMSVYAHSGALWHMT